MLDITYFIFLTFILEINLITETEGENAVKCFSLVQRSKAVILYIECECICLMFTQIYLFLIYNYKYSYI